MLLVLLLITSTLMILLFKYKNSEREKAFASFPQPKSMISIQNVIGFFGSHPGDLLLKNLKKYHDELGEVFLMKFHPFHCGIALVADAAIAKKVSLHQPDRSGANFYKVFSRFTGDDCYYLSSGSRLKAFMTAAIKYAFSRHAVERFDASTSSQCNKALSILSLPSSNPCDIRRFFHKLLFDIVFESQFNFNFNSLDGSNSEYLEALEEFFTYLTRASANLSFTGFISDVPFFNKGDRSLKFLRNFITNIIEDRRLLLSSTDHPEIECTLDSYLTEPVDGKLLSNEEVCSEMNSFIFGAQGTTKSTLTFLFYSLAKHADVQQKVYDELKEKLGDNFDQLSSEAVKDLPYIEAVINETLRLYPIGPVLARKLKSEIITGGFTFPKNVEVYISPYLMGRNPKYFKDPLTFNPDRFLGLEEPPIGFIPFSIGARKCTGDKIGINMMKIVIAKLCSRFKVSLARDYGKVLGVTLDMTLAPKETILLNFEKRNE